MQTEITQTTEISVKGRRVACHSAVIDGRTVVVVGKWLRHAQVRDEDFVEGEIVSDPRGFLEQLRAKSLKADLFSFAQSISDPQPRHSEYDYELDNAAAIRLTTYDEWWRRLSQESRRNVRLGEKRGLKAQVVPFDDRLVHGIKGIYDEQPMRQGRKFWHYGKDFERVRAENGTYVERSDFIGAYLEDELVGFIKMVAVDRKARIMQILSKSQHFDKRPGNVLLAKAVEVACQKQMNLLTYSNYTYRHRGPDSITEFKRRNCFEELVYPRYFIPLTLKGRMALQAGFHHGLVGMLPRKLVACLHAMRTRYYETTLRKCS